jgi:hypothetical protein
MNGNTFKIISLFCAQLPSCRRPILSCLYSLLPFLTQLIISALYRYFAAQPLPHPVLFTPYLPIQLELLWAEEEWQEQHVASIITDIPVVHEEWGIECNRDIRFCHLRHDC